MKDKRPKETEQETEKTIQGRVGNKQTPKYNQYP